MRIFSCRTLNDFYKLLVIIVIYIKKQWNWPYKHYYVKMSQYFCRKCNHLFFKCSKNWKRSGIRIWQIPEDRFFGDGMYIVLYIATTSTLEFIQILSKKRIYLSERIPDLAQAFNCSSIVTHYQVCVCCVSSETYV